MIRWASTKKYPNISKQVQKQLPTKNNKSKKKYELLKKTMDLAETEGRADAADRAATWLLNLRAVLKESGPTPLVYPSYTIQHIQLTSPRFQM